MPGELQHPNMAPRGTVWRISFVVPGALTEPFELMLGRFAAAISSHADATAEQWTVEGFSDAEPDRQAVETAVAATARDLDIEAPGIRFDLEPTIDWLTQNLESFPPVAWGRYWIAGSHLADAPPPGKIPLRIDAGTAFGSGEHPTTGGCLTMFDRLAKRMPPPRRILDLGCGSGILAIAAAKTWTADITAADIDPESVRVSRRHALLNGLGPRIRPVVADSYRRAAIAHEAPYDLIVANILARPLARLSRGLARSLAPDGMAVISGLLSRDGNWMAECHRRQGLRIADRIEIDGWLTLVLRR